MLISGGKRILKDVCWLAGLIAGMIFIGLHNISFEFLKPQFPLYKDVWSGFPMLIISSCQYTVSVLVYASSDCIHEAEKPILNSIQCIKNLIFGLFKGIVIAFLIKNWF